MAVIDIKKPHTMTLDEVRETAQHLVDRLHTDFGVTHSWQDNVVNFKCAPKGINGTMTVLPDQLQLKVKLGFLASIFERTLRTEIDNYLDEHVR